MLVKTFIAVLLANIFSMGMFFFVATWWVHKVVDVAADRHIATQFNKAVDRQTNRLIESFKSKEAPSKKLQCYPSSIKPKLKKLRETSSVPTEKLRILRGR